MVIFRLFDLPSNHSMSGGAPTALAAAIAESFHPHMFPMAALFASLCAAVGLFDGYLRATVAIQKAKLEGLLDVDRARRRELASRYRQLVDLQRTNQRAMRFMIHDFKTPLACIIGFASVLRAKLPPDGGPELHHSLERINRQARRLKSAVEDLLTLARMEGKGLQPRLQ
jgi:signal transduction histidine kinase